MTNPVTGVRVQGLNQLLRGLKAAGVEVADMKDVFGRISREAAAVAAGLAPSRTGRLRASIRPSKARNYAAVTVGGKRVPYAAAINYGWPRRHIRASRFLQRTDLVMRPRAVRLLDMGIATIIRQKGL